MSGETEVHLVGGGREAPEVFVPPFLNRNDERRSYDAIGARVSRKG